MRFPELVLIALLLIHRSTHLPIYASTLPYRASLPTSSPTRLVCPPIPPQARARGHATIVSTYGQTINTKPQISAPITPACTST